MRRTDDIPRHDGPPVLTIGIPTYNFGKFIGETLDAFLTDLPARVEILVVDGASSDDTQAVVMRRQGLTSALRYVKLAARGGIDADVAMTIDLARGEYVWLFSADDVPVAGAVADVLALIGQRRPDVAVLAHAGCTIDMKIVHERYPILFGGDVETVLRDTASRVAYLRGAVTSEAFFSFLSGLVVKRKTWAEAEVERDFKFGSCWAHAARLLSLTKGKGLRVFVHTAPLLNRRGDNDSFLDRGIVARYALAIEGWQDVFRTLFGNDGPEIIELRRVLRNEFSIGAFLRAKLAHADGADQRDWLRSQFNQIYASSFRERLYRAMLWHLPSAVIVGLFRAKQAWRAVRG